MKEQTVILSDKLNLPEEMAWFSKLDPEERNVFLTGLLNLIAMDDGRREEALNDYLQSWREKSAPESASPNSLGQAFLDRVEQELDTLLAHKKPAGDLVKDVRSVRKKSGEVWSDPVNQAFFERFADEESSSAE